MRDLAATALELVSIPSVSREEEALCAFVQEWARGILSEDEVLRQGNGLVVKPHPRGNRPLIGLFGHLDTVPPAADQPLGIRDGRLYGCGASDMKAGLALMIAAVEQRAELASDIVAVFYDKEEIAASENGLEDLLPLLPAMDLAVMHEPTANRLQLGCVGGLHALLHFDGRRAHSARPWHGENAIYKSLDLLGKFQARERREVVVDGLPFYEVMTPTMAWTHRAANVVPDAFTLNVNFRFAPGRSLEDAEAELRKFVGDAARVEIRDRAPSGAVCRNVPLVSRWIERCGLEVESKQAWTDVARMTGRGVPAVNFGPGDPAQAHQAGEWVSVEAIDEGWRLLKGLLT
ncbi:MAG: succinyl-diaminopimelate desuccinylase [Armatimonadetes bacterium]|nr:succinyl-diaminopimelate desuccinylase [Armatimonadota bacterium]